MKKQLLVMLVLAGCQSTKVSLQNEIQPPARFEQGGGGAAVDVRQWWQSWNDPVLNELMAKALTGSFDVRVAESRWREAAALAGLAAADRGPQLGASAKGSYSLAGKMDNPLPPAARQQLANNPTAAALQADKFDMTGSNVKLALSASWEPDFFGKKQSDADAARFASQAAEAQLQGAKLLTTAAIADAYFQARAAEQQLALNGEQANTLAQLANYLDGRFRAGRVSAAEKDAVASKLKALHSQRSTLQLDYDRQRRALAVLTGQPPQGFKLPAGRADLLQRPPAPPAGQKPSDLLQRRPDLMAKAALVRVQAAQLASAKADLLPRFTLDFSLPFFRISGDSQMQLWNAGLGANMTLPIFTNGRLQANINAADAKLKTALLEYDQTLLQALADVDNGFQAVAALGSQTDELTEAVRLADTQAGADEKLFKYGRKTLDAALQTRLDSQELAVQRLRSQLGRAQALTALYKALGGGW